MYSNQHVTRVFEEIRDALSILGEEPFKVRAYQLAALRIQNLSEPLVDVITRGDKIPGVGESLLRKAKEILETGTCRERESLRYEVPDSVLTLLRIPHVGPKTVAHLYFEHGIDSLDALEKALQHPERLNLSPKLIEKIRVGLPLARQERTRFSLGYALSVLTEFEQVLKKECTIEQLTFAGSVRRYKSTVRDGDILVVAPPDEVSQITEVFTTHSLVYEVQGKGDTKASIRTHEGYQVDLRVVPLESWGASANYFTGAKQFNIKLRTLGQSKNLFINEYGYFRGSSSGQRLGGEREEHLFELLGIQFVPPELREDTGEVELAQQFALPKLLELNDIKGDTHVHSKWSDGTATLEELARCGDQLGYEWIIVCDHSKGLGVAGGLDEEKLRRRNAEIDAINASERYTCRLLKGVEVEVRKDGTLDLNDDILTECNYVIAAVHSSLDNVAEALSRALKALAHPLVHALAHPLGRQFRRREEGPLAPYFDQIAETARKNGKMLELNSDPGRLDLDEVHTRKAASLGVVITLGSDAHFVPEQLRHLQLGVGLARRAWLGPEHVLNTYALPQLLARLRR